MLTPVPLVVVVTPLSVTAAPLVAGVHLVAVAVVHLAVVVHLVAVAVLRARPRRRLKLIGTARRLRLTFLVRLVPTASTLVMGLSGLRMTTPML